MIAALDDAPVVDDQDLVGIDDSRQAMGDDQGGMVTGGFPQRLQDGLLGLAVQGGSSLIEEKDLGPLQDGARDGDPLLLTP